MAKKGLSAYDKKFYNNLLMVAKDIIGSYSIIVPSLPMLAAMMNMPYSDAWMFAFNRFKRNGNGFVTKINSSEYWIEVLPF